MAFCFPWRAKRKKKHQEAIIPQLDPVLLDILHWCPWKEMERQQFDNRKLQQHIKIHPEGVGAKYEFKSAGRGNIMRYPLFRAVALGASIDVVQHMYDIFPDAIHETGNFSTTPLHAACVYRASLEVIEFLLTQYPSASKIRNKHLNYPIHFACEYGVSTPSVIKILVEVNPQALKEKNKLGQTPYQIIQRKDTSADPDVLRILQEYYQQQATITTNTSGEFIVSSAGGSTEEEPDSSSLYFGGLDG
mmetsp:Transcript_8132/g.12700  ORF Transcript_8132/g.12700 Transcript_8132/m.12700 type:complete len:247 (-) Transcript_8132:75-815(-)|eukprot:CAMPEP_0194227652 /NCGR_PEP_ID=MMETSP0156-20130528/42967_1 /TAXON_ID=33649 /ORGANISM="Thalassionema nitzschioides, Strain L26-B" /LENGTH=246 /DNA_ID=CAMNT_0038960141 /DNA_START=412 /DNA_END=1152 /DNA_ORIENTATION=+